MADEETMNSILPLSRVVGPNDWGPVSSAPVSSGVVGRGAPLAASLLVKVLEAVPAALVVVDEYDRVVVANGALRNLLLVQGDSLLGYSVGRFLSIERLQHARGQLLLELSSSQSTSGNAPIAGATNKTTDFAYRDLLLVGGVERGVECKVEQIESEGAQFWCIALQDRTNIERELAERAGDAMEPASALDQAHHLEALGRLTGNLAHDFNNFLSVILGSLERARRRITQGDDPEADLVRALTATERSIQSTSQILRYSRHRDMRAESVDPACVLVELKELIGRSVGDGIELLIEMKETAPIRVGAAQLETAVLNLVLNARDAISGGGKIRVVLDQLALDDSQAVKIGLIAGVYVVITVIDDGIGMSDHVQEHVFQPFYTTKAEGQGTGLGLSSVRTLATQLGGAAQIESVLGEGTSVRLFFPALL